MPKKADEKYRTAGGTYLSQNRASMKYQESLDTVKFTVRKGMRDKIKDYVADSDKYENVNDMLCQLVANEMGLDVDEVKLSKIKDERKKTKQDTSVS